MPAKEGSLPHEEPNGKTTTGINVPLFTDVLVLLTLNKNSTGIGSGKQGFFLKRSQ